MSVTIKTPCRCSENKTGFDNLGDNVSSEIEVYHNPLTEQLAILIEDVVVINGNLF